MQNMGEVEGEGETTLTDLVVAIPFILVRSDGSMTILESLNETCKLDQLPDHREVFGLHIDIELGSYLLTNPNVERLCPSYVG